MRMRFTFASRVTVIHFLSLITLRVGLGMKITEISTSSHQREINFVHYAQDFALARLRGSLNVAQPQNSAAITQIWNP